VPIPRITKYGWTAVTLLERDPVMQQPADKVRRSAYRRARLSRVPLRGIVTGRTAADVRVQTRRAELPDGTVLPLRIYRPRARTADVLPVVVNFHGGGFVSGDAYQSEWWCSGIAAQAGVVVVSVDYRLAPEHRYPTPPEDCYAATEWVAKNAAELGVDASRLAVMGDSAGGNLAAVVALMARDRGGPRIALQVLIYPSVEMIDTLPSEIENADGPCLTKRDVDNVPYLYLADRDRDGREPYASPLRGDATRLPTAVIQTAQHDPLRDHGIRYADHLRAAGVEARHTNYVDAVHGYISIPGLVPAAKWARADAVAEIRELLG
jgi:acetyl esterase